MPVPIGLGRCDASSADDAKAPDTIEAVIDCWIALVRPAELLLPTVVARAALEVVQLEEYIGLFSAVGVDRPYGSKG